MSEFIQPILFQITSTRLYIVTTISQKRGRTPRVVEYVIVLVLFYLIAIFLLHKVYRFFVNSVKKQKGNFLFACDAILYQFQYQNLNNPQNITWIQEIIKKASYEQSYEFLLEKISLLSWEKADQLAKQLKKTYHWYTSASRRKTLCWVFLMIITLWVYKLFLEN